MGNTYQNILPKSMVITVSMLRPETCTDARKRSSPLSLDTTDIYIGERKLTYIADHSKWYVSFVMYDYIEDCRTCMLQRISFTFPKKTRKHDIKCRSRRETFFSPKFISLFREISLHTVLVMSHMHKITISLGSISNLDAGTRRWSVLLWDFVLGRRCCKFVCI